MPTKFKVFDTRRVPSPDPDRVGQEDIVVMYELDPMRRYMVRIPAEKFSEEEMIHAVQKDMEERAKFAGKEYEIP